MIMLVVNICLTVRAWRKGWKARALLPMAIGYVLAFLVGAVMADSHAPWLARIIFAIVIEIGMVGSLIALGRNGPSRKTRSEPPASLSSAVAPASEAPTP